MFWEEQVVGIIQFFMLLFFVLIYVGIVGALLARVMRRSMDSFLKDRDEKAESVPVGG
jgi:hypothetical protein